jgi:pyruvate dehydrogenase E1 component alpha subunit
MLSRKRRLEMLRRMTRIRQFEERLGGLYDYESYLRKGDTTGDEYDFASKGVIAGAIHLSCGQEAAEVGICAALRRDDYVTSTHRGHGHCIAKGADLGPMMAELLGREDGYSRGCGGSMHIFCPDIGMLGGNGIVGAQIPLATGAAFSAKYRGTKQVAVAFFSEGASNQGTLHEALNLAALWKLPVLFVCENNLYAATTFSTIALATPDVADRAFGFGIPGVIVDGQDVLAVYDVAARAVARARAGRGPTLIECKTYRFYSHCGAAGRKHNNPEELQRWLPRDPIALFERRLLAERVVTAAALQALQQEVQAEVDAAVDFAKASPVLRFSAMPAEVEIAL